MSQLFDALQKLEEKSSVQAQPLPSLSSRKKERVRPSFRILILGILIITCFCLAFLWLQPDLTQLSTLPQKDKTHYQDNIVVPAANDSLQKEEKEGEPVNTSEKNAVEEITPVQPVQTIKETVQISAQTIPFFSETAKLSPEKSEETETREKDSVSINNETQSFPEIQNTADSWEMIRDKQQVERKRLLYRAEQQRINGNLDLALELYIEAWDTGGGAGVANNIAAILIGKKEYILAEEYLRKALAIAPSDRDLLYNLEIISAEKNRQQPHAPR